MVTSFHEVRFPELISWGARGGAGFDTSVVEFASGKEQRNQNWTRGRMEWDVTSGVKVQDDLDELIAFFRARRGRAFGFRYKDFTDFKLTQEVLQNNTDDSFVGDGVTTVFKIVKRYELVSPPPALAAVNVDIRRIFKLRGGAGDPLSELTEGVRVNTVPETLLTIDRNAGTVTFDVAPAASSVCDITTEYDVPARFDVDKMSVSIEDFNAYTWGGITIKELNPLLEPA